MMLPDNHSNWSAKLRKIGLDYARLNGPACVDGYAFLVPDVRKQCGMFVC